MSFHPIHVAPDVRGALSATYTAATAKLQEFVTEHQGTLIPAVEGDDADDEALVFVELPKEAILELGSEENKSFIDDIGAEIVQKHIEPNGDIQDGGIYTGPLEPAEAFN